MMTTPSLTPAPNAMTPTRRRTDTDKLAHWDEVLKRYGIFWLPLVWLVGSLGFSLITPKMTANQLKEVLDSVAARLQREIDANRRESRAADSTITDVHSELIEQVKMLLRYDCLDQLTSEHDKKAIGLPCDQLLSHKEVQR